MPWRSRRRSPELRSILQSIGEYRRPGFFPWRTHFTPVMPAAIDNLLWMLVWIAKRGSISGRCCRCAKPKSSTMPKAPYGIAVTGIRAKIAGG